MAYQLDQNPSEALSFCERAIGVCRQRVLLLQSQGLQQRSGGAEEASKKDGEKVDEESGRGHPPASDSAEAEIGDLELLLTDMEEKVWLCFPLILRMPLRAERQL